VYSRGVSSSEKVFQCDDCYKEWKKKVKKATKKNLIKDIAVSFFGTIALILWLFIVRPKWFEKMNNSPIASIFFIISVFIVFLITKRLLELNRYEAKERNKNKEKKGKWRLK